MSLNDLDDGLNDLDDGLNDLDYRLNCSDDGQFQANDEQNQADDDKNTENVGLNKESGCFWPEKVRHQEEPFSIMLKKSVMGQKMPEIRRRTSTSERKTDVFTRKTSVFSRKAVPVRRARCQRSGPPTGGSTNQQASSNQRMAGSRSQAGLGKARAAALVADRSKAA